jgi:class 3 adenylate cyclase/tetratricopeptide (TPR) repeat protein
MTTRGGGAGSALLPYVPRLVADWAATSPGDQCRALDATMVFADLSGFTAMSERLSRLGPMGAEEVTDAIGATFAELLAVAYDLGGGLLKFGGDALLLAFLGDGHPLRGVTAAAAMRAKLRELGPIKTAAGNVTLRMSVGVHCGEFDCFLVGEPTRELLLTGPAASHVVAMEGTASAGQVVLSTATCDRIPAEYAGKPIGDGVLLRRAPPRGASRADEFRDRYDDVDLGAFIPTAVHEHVMSGGGAPEHRMVTVAFVHFDGIDARVRDDGLAATAAALDELVTVVERACEEHSVALLATDVDADGGKFVLVAGAPALMGHDEARTLATVRHIIDAETAIPVRIGVNRGAVFAGDVGPHYRRTYTVMGDTVNLAARLMAKARPGTIVATADVVDRAPRFATTALPPFSVKGKRAPVHAFEVGEATRSRDEQLPAARELPFRGRQTELWHLEALLTDARAGRGRLVRIIGPAGIGKSRLVSELRAKAHDCEAITITIEAYERATPYATIFQLMHAVLDIPVDAEPTAKLMRLASLVSLRVSHLAGWLPLLARVLDLEIDDTPETEALAAQNQPGRTADVIVDLLCACWRSPILVTLDDTEWLDDASREVLDTLARSVGQSHALVVYASRDDSQSVAAEDPPITLEPLADDDIRSVLVEATADAPLRPHEIDALAERSGGNPLFLHELWRSVGSRTESDALPDTIDALLTSQIDQLPPAQRTLLGYAAVLGRTFDSTDLEWLVRDDFTLSADAWVLLTDFVDVDRNGRATFRHGLLRDTAYAKLPFRRRRELHARAARALEANLLDRRDAPVEVLSLHYYNAAEYEPAWETADLAGRRAAELYANVEATALLERALAAAKRLPKLDPLRVAGTRELLADLCDRSGEYERALREYRVARRLVRANVIREAELLEKEAWIHERIARYADAVRSIRKGQKLVADLTGSDALRARARLDGAYGAIRQGQGKHQEAIVWCARAIEEAHAVGDAAQEAHACYILDWAYAEAGRFDLATHSARALELYGQLGDIPGQGHVLNNLGAFAYMQGRWDEAIDLFERAGDAYTRAGSAVDAARTKANIAQILSDRGSLEEAEHLLNDALAIALAAGYHYDIALIRGYLGRNCTRGGRFEEGLALLEASRDEYEAAGLTLDVVRIDGYRAEALLLSGATSAADELAERALNDLRHHCETSPEEPMLLRIRAQAQQQLGDVDAALALLEASLEATDKYDADFDRALGLDVALTLPGATADVDLTRAERDELAARLGLHAMK